MFKSMEKNTNVVNRMNKTLESNQFNFNILKQYFNILKLMFGILEVRNRVTQNDFTLRVTNSEIFKEILLSSY